MEVGAPKRRELVFGLLAALLAGVVVGMLGTFKHHVGVGAASGAGLPIGLVVGLAAIAAFLVALRLSFPVRWFAVVAGAGVLVAVGALATRGPGGGSQVILGDWVGTVWLIGAVVVVLAVAVWPRRRWRSPSPGILDDVPHPRTGEEPT